MQPLSARQPWRMKNPRGQREQQPRGNKLGRTKKGACQPSPHPGRRKKKWTQPEARPPRAPGGALCMVDPRPLNTLLCRGLLGGQNLLLLELSIYLPATMQINIFLYSSHLTHRMSKLLACLFHRQRNWVWGRLTWQSHITNHWLRPNPICSFHVTSGGKLC